MSNRLSLAAGALALVGLLSAGPGCRLDRSTLTRGRMRQGSDTRSALVVRALAQPSGHRAFWITTADDGVEGNGRFEGRHVLLGVHSRRGLEALEPRLADEGLGPGERIDVVVVGEDSADAWGALDTLTSRWTVDHVVGNAPRHHPRGRPSEPASLDRQDYGGRLAGYLDLGGEVTARVVPADARVAAGVELRFIDVSVWIPAGSAAAGPTVPAEVDAEIRVGHEGARIRTEAQTLDAILPDDGLRVLETNGWEAVLPGGLYRTRHRHYIECTQHPCATTLELPADGPLVVPAELPPGSPGWFLVDTRAPATYVSRDRLARLAVGNTQTHVTTHGARSMQSPVPPLVLGTLRVHGIRAQPVPTIAIGGQRIAGVIGRDLLEAFHLRLLPEASQLHLEVAVGENRAARLPEATEGETELALPLDWSPAGPLILGTVDGEDHSWVLATGVERTLLSVPPGDTERTPAVLETPLLASGKNHIPEWMHLEDPLESYPARELELGGVSLGARTLWVPARPLTADLLGMDFVRDYRQIEIDFRKRQLRLTTK